MKITRRSAVAALAGAAVLPAAAWAQFERAVRLIVASSAGSTIDVIGRTLQQPLAAAVGAPVVVENIAGAGSVIAMQTLARAPADGSVLALQTNNMVTAPLMMKTAPYDTVKDFTPIAMIGAIPLALVTNASKVGAANAKEFVALLKTTGDKLNYGSSGNGTTLHLAVEQIQDELGVKLNHVPYKGVAPMVNDLIGGQIDFAVSALPPVQPHINSGALRAIGLLSNQRVAVAPEIPTLAEQGFPNFNMDVWMAVLGPRNMAPATVKKVHDALLATVNTPGIREALEKQGNIVKVSTSAEALVVVQRDVAKYSALAKKINLTPQ
nr:tripartite tricarboxylate transporter substrate binding protein [Variovorax paradoxus]